MGRVLVIGGAGFIGSHLVDTFMMRNEEVTVFDNLSTGTLVNIGRWLDNAKFTFIKGDLLNANDLKKLEINEYEFIFHLAANPEVRLGSVVPSTLFDQNVVATQNLLEFLRQSDNRPILAFSSTSTVYGEALKIPTPEDYGPLKPISIYGATKLACEGLISAYAYTYGFKAIIFRVANVVGPRSKHGVVYDFVEKLRKNSNELEILGDGTQTKSYLHVNDCVNAMIHAVEKSNGNVEIFNIASEDQVDVRTVAQIVIKELGLDNVRLIFTGGVDGGRGWKGDVKNMLLDISKIKKLGWRPELDSKRAIREAVKSLKKF